jgi:hypothetical protein
MKLGDREVGGTPPAKLLRALAVIADEMHPAFDRVPRIPKDKSKESCVLCSLAVRDFLWKVGLKDAKVAPVYAIVRALAEDGSEIHSVGAGDHAAIPVQAARHGHVTDTSTRWSGHLVVLVDGWLVDTTLYQASHEQWRETLPGMIAAPLLMDERDGTTLVAGAAAKQDDGSDLFVAWWDQPHNTRWRDAPDATDRSLRAPVVKSLVQRFGRWVDGSG